MLTQEHIVPGALFTNADPADKPLTLTLAVSARRQHNDQWTLTRLEHLPWALSETFEAGSTIVVPTRTSSPAGCPDADARAGRSGGAGRD